MSARVGTADLYRFARNAVVRASAGTGKTETLTGLYVHLVAGAWAGQRSLSPARIVAVTFTDKAAEEMRERVGLALRALRVELDLPEAQRGGARSRVASLVLSALAAEGRTLAVADLDHALMALATAPITTFHSYAARLLRELAGDLHMDATFDTLPAFEAEEWKQEAVVQAILAKLGTGDALVEDLLRDHGGVSGRAGLASVVLPLLNELRESGKEPESLLDLGGYTQAAVAAALAEAHRDLGMTHDGDLAAAWRRVAEVHATAEVKRGGRKATYEGIHRAGREALASLEAGAPDATGLAHALALLQEAVDGKAFEREEPARSLRESAHDVLHLRAEAARAQALVGLVADAMARYAARKTARNVVDFTDQIRLVRDALADNPALRDEVASRIDALLVDEFQDTNALQRDLVYLLRAKPGTPKGVPSAADVTATGLLVVGDRKQSIYGFRNADVSVFEGVARDIVEGGGMEVALSTSYRSVDRLVTGLNELSAAALSERSEHSFVYGYDHESESLQAFHAVDDGDPRLTLLQFPEKGEGTAKAREATAIADFLVQMARGQATVPVRDRVVGGLRRASFGDVALLLPAFSQVATYLRALSRRGIPYVVENGRGLHDTVESRDVHALLSVLRDDDDGVGLAALLRGPMLMLSDGGLQTLGEALRGRWHGLWKEVPAGLSADEDARLRSFLALLHRARQTVDRAGFGRAARAVMDATDYRAVLLAQPAGESRVANVERLLGELTAREDGGEDGRLVGLEFLRRAASLAEAEAAGRHSNADAVRIMTVHQSKGLQFPVVIAADLGRRARSETGPVLYDRDPLGGLAVALRDVRGQWAGSRRRDRVSAVVTARRRAEARRLFYVQITRAEDHLVLVGAGQNIRKEVVEPVHGSLAERGLLRVVEGAGATGVTPPAVAAVDTAALLRQAAAQARPASAGQGPIHVSVTQIEDFVLCARRFRARHLLRLPERPRPLPEIEMETWEGWGTAEAKEDPRLRGIVVHGIMELVSFAELARDPDAALRAAAAQAGVTMTDEHRHKLMAFAQSPLAARLATVAPAHIHREVPFVLQLSTPGGDVRVRGQIDLLYEHDGALHVVDHKVTNAKDPQAYAFQLALYAEAVRRAYRTAQVTAGILFLDGVGRDAMPVDLQAVRLADVTSSLANLHIAARSQRYPGVPRPQCDAIACGYRWLCYPDGAPQEARP